MRLLTKNLTRTVWVLCLLGFFVSCQDTLPQRSTITPGSTSDDIPTCPEGQELVEDTIEGQGNEPDEKVLICKDKPLVRPDNAVFWKSNFCACKNGKPVSYGNCSSYCSGKATDDTETLFADFSVTEDISLGGLGNMYAWCKTPFEGDEQNPECELQAKDENNNITYLEVNVPLNSNSMTVNIGGLANDKTYVLTLVEKVSGAKSNSVQMIKFSSDTTLPVLGPLKNAPVTQYTCMVREFSTAEGTGDIYYDTAYRLHFYFVPRVPPNPVPAGNSNLICHDIFNPLYGIVDQELYPRFEQLPGVFNLWDTTDPRFYDNNGNGSIDVNEAIIQKTKSFGGSIPLDTNFFQTFSWPGSPQLEEDAGDTNTTQSLGYFMAPWIDQTTFKSYCLNSTHYNSTNPLFKAMRDIIGVDTEGLYIGEKAPETVQDSDGNFTSGFPDYILIRETDLKQVWFYLKNGVPTVPTDTNVTNEAVYFYYPLNKASPFVRTSTQRIFRVKGASELNDQSNLTNGATSSGSTTTFPPHDRKIGCVPKF
ncbi:MAG: hypothetical protein ACLGHN_01420 [Bacteriovoracia bacterium]